MLEKWKTHVGGALEDPGPGVGLSVHDGPGDWGPPGGTGAGSSLPPLTVMVPPSVGRAGGKENCGTGQVAGRRLTECSHSAKCRNHRPAY